VKIRWCASATVLALVVTGFAWACDHAGKAGGCGGAKVAGAGCSKTCGSKSDCAKTCSDQDVAGACRVKDVVAAGAPMLKYVVGDETVCCYKKALELADGDSARVRYVIGDAKYTDRAEAMKAFADRLEEYLNSFTTVRYAVGERCVASFDEATALARETGQAVRYRVASVSFADRAPAEEAAGKARSAAEAVRMKLVKDGQEVACDKDAPKIAEKGCRGKKSEQVETAGEYVVGELKTTCPMTARIELAKARIVAAYRAVQQDNPDLAATGAPAGS